jgi:hypothetical protein
MGKKSKTSEVITSDDLPAVEGGKKPRKTRENVDHGENIAVAFEQAQVPAHIVAKYRKEMMATEECEKNLAEARKRRQRAYNACKVVSKYADVVVDDDVSKAAS